MDWPVSYAGCDDCVALTSLPSSEKTSFEEMAAEYLWRWTGRRYGLIEATLRPCRQNCGESTFATGSPWTPELIGGQWYNIGCGSCNDRCGCGSYGTTLRFGKRVSSISSIVIDGVTLDPAAYRLDDGVLLQRQDGGRWPYCQDMEKPAGETNTWTITATFGEAVPIGGQLAAGKLACELAKAACGDSGCELPQRWQTISRQGVTISAALDTFEDIDKGHTGIWLIDSWVASVTKPRVQFAMASPDLRPTGRQTTVPVQPNVQPVGQSGRLYPGG